ncbi:VWA domain-containing protein [Globicatella sulfidifaciens]|uniref:vWA domain-containing protein n=1 Tax=Globicatella sulfidifaciens TaxID=136093 RepID=UPI00288DA679|nr:VWA domain-containing protein [Globicatella sulfidifaciens]MDT2768949.1 VWA domain-containing protein [Globicatella sulfidifaciens]
MKEKKLIGKIIQFFLVFVLLFTNQVHYLTVFSEEIQESTVENNTTEAYQESTTITVDSPQADINETVNDQESALVSETSTEETDAIIDEETSLESSSEESETTETTLEETTSAEDHEVILSGVTNSGVTITVKAMQSDFSESDEPIELRVRELEPENAEDFALADPMAQYIFDINPEVFKASIKFLNIEFYQSGEKVEPLKPLEIQISNLLFEEPILQTKVYQQISDGLINELEHSWNSESPTNLSLHLSSSNVLGLLSIHELFGEPGEIAPGIDNMLPTDGSPTPVSLQYFQPGELGPFTQNNTLFRSRSMTRANSQQTDELQPGEVRTKKTAVPSITHLNTWEITVEVEAQDYRKDLKTDIVLVIDRSGSMANDDRMTNATESAKNFVTQILDKDPNNSRVAIVSFASEARIDSRFSSNNSYLQSRINNISAEGGTFTQGGLKQAENLIVRSTADRKYIVLLSDGEPTFSYLPVSRTYGLERKTEKRYGTYRNQNGGFVIAGAYTYNNNYVSYSNQTTFDYGQKIGNGGSILGSTNYNDDSYPISLDGYSNPFYPVEIKGEGRNRYYSPVNLTYYNHGDAAIRESQIAKASGINGLYTIAVGAGVTGTNILNQMANEGMAFSTNDPSALQGIYDTIADSIQSQPVFSTANVNDEMGLGFEVKGDILNIEVNTGTAQLISKVATTNQTISWDFNGMPEVDKANRPGYRRATLKYTVEVTPDLLEDVTNDQKQFETNKSTVLNYTDSQSNENKRVEITSPQVNPVLMKVKKTLLDIDGKVDNSEDTYRFKLGETDIDSDIKANIEYEYFLPPFNPGDYQLLETAIISKDGKSIPLDDYNISYKINGIEGNLLKINSQNNSEGINDFTLEVINQIKPIKIKLTKKVSGNMGEREREFNFEGSYIRRHHNDAKELDLKSLKHNDSQELTLPRDAILNLAEVNVPEEYNVTYQINGISTEKVENLDLSYSDVKEDAIEIIVTNTKDKEIATGIHDDLKPYMILLAILTLVILIVGIIYYYQHKNEEGLQ